MTQTQPEEAEAPWSTLCSDRSIRRRPLSTKELRKVLRLHKVPTTGLLEKAEFVAAAKQHLGLQ